MKEYSRFVSDLKYQVSQFYNVPLEEWKPNALLHVNGLAGSELRHLVKLETRRKSGAFFTSHEMAMFVLRELSPSFAADSIIYDPAVGAANLLIAVSEYLRQESPEHVQSSTLLGTDLHTEFVDAAKQRLTLNMLIHSDSPGLQNSQFEVLQKDGLVNNSFFRKATHVVMNPPFNQMLFEQQFTWASGKICAAAVFLNQTLKHVTNETSIVAILPDVLRSGSRYKKWRQDISRKASIKKIIPLGQFDQFADVDVFAIHLVKDTDHEETSIEFNTLDGESRSKKVVLSDIFEVSVGKVVDNRDEHSGSRYPYIVSRGLESWTIKREFDRTRKHFSKPMTGPFVVVKRTSRKSDKNRANATIIHLNRPVIVDNHLIVLKPKSGTLRDCRQLMDILNSRSTDQWINTNICCRHLTVAVLKKLPIKWTD